MLSQISTAVNLDPAPRPTVASQTIADRSPIGTSFRFHRPRGPLCGRGYCFQCEIATPQGRALACQTEAAVDTLGLRRDLLRPLGRLAERFPPWFYERRFLRPYRLSGLGLHVLRYLSAAPSLRDVVREASDDGRRYTRIETEKVVIGSASAEDGAYRVDLAEGRLAFGFYPDRTLGVLDRDGVKEVRFERCVLGTGSYERLPPIAGNDLPGVIGFGALEVYTRSGAVARGTRIAVWAPGGTHQRVRAWVAEQQLSLAWMGDRAPTAILGRRRVEGVTVEEDVRCDFFVVGVAQPAIELALQGGATAELTNDGLPILVLKAYPEWMEIQGAAAAQTSGVPDVRADDAAFACLCEDVRVGDLRQCVEQGFAHPELVKRRTGVMTGPCQGKLCAPAVLATLRRMGVDATATRARPLARPVRLEELAAHA